MPFSLKRWIGLGLLEVCEQVPRSKPFLRRWGMRTSQEWFAGRVVRARMPDGRDLRLAGIAQNYLAFELFWRGTNYYEPISSLVARELTRKADAFIDIGANIGFFSLMLSAMQPGLRVVAFEPNPKNFRLLQANAQLNGFDQLTCLPVALSSTSGSTVLYLSRSDMSASLEREFDPVLGTTVQVEMTSLDDYLGRCALPGRLVIKVDVEGHEPAFFKGAERTLAERQPDIITEVTLNQDRLPVPFLKQAGYRFYQITDEGLLPAVVPAPFTRGDFRFLNCLLSARPEQEMAELFRRIQPAVRALDLAQTSKYVSRELLHRFPAPAAKPLTLGKA